MEPIEVLRRRIEERKSSIALFLTGGGCKSMDDYARATGKYEALTPMRTSFRTARTAKWETS
jgi:hypothetical protein